METSGERAARRGAWWQPAMHNRLIALVLAMVVLVPLVASPADARLAGMSTFVLESFALLLLFTLVWRARFDLRRENVLTFLKTGANLPVLLLFGLATVSCFMAPHKAFAIQGWLQLGAGVLLYFVVAYHFRQSKHLSMLVDTLMFLTLMVALAVTGQYVLDAGRGTVLYGNQQPLGSLLAVLLPMVAVVALTEKQMRRQLVAQAATIFAIGSLLLAQSRSAWVGAAGALLTLGALALVAPVRKQGQALPLAARKHQLVLPALLVVIALGFFAAVMVANQGIGGRLSTLRAVGHDVTWSQRLQMWHGAERMIADKPLTGWGVGQYPVYQQRFTGWGQPIREGGIHVSLAEQAHNFYLQLAAELGLPGLLLMVAVLGAFLMAAWRRLPELDEGVRRTLLLGSMAASVGFALDAFGSPSWHYGQVSMFLWLMLGAGVACIRPRSRHEEAPVPELRRVRVVRPMALVTAALLMSLVIMPSLGVAVSAAGPYNPTLPPGPPHQDNQSTTNTVLGVVFITLLGTFIFGPDGIWHKVSGPDNDNG